MQNFNNSIIIGPNSIKKALLSLKVFDVKLNFDFYTKEEVLHDIFGKFSKNAVKILLENNKEMHFIEASKIISFIERGAVLSDKYPYLYDEKILFRDEYSKLKYKDKKIFFIGYLDNDPEIKNIIKNLNLNNFSFLKFGDIFECKEELNYYEFESIQKEIEFALNNICGKIKKDNLSAKNFYIFCNESKYGYYLKIYSDLFKLPITFSNKNTLADSYSGKLLINNFSNFRAYINENENLFDSDKENFELIIQIYDDYNFGNNQLDVNDFKNILLRHKIIKEKYSSAVEIGGKIDFADRKFVYVLGASSDFIPCIKKNNDIFDDKEKIKLNLADSNIQNELNFNECLDFLKSKNVEWISFNSSSGKIKPAFILTNNGFNQIKCEISKNLFSTKLAEINYKKLLHKYYEFHVVDDVLNKLSNDFKEVYYDHKYQNIGVKNENITHSYTALEEFSECPFKYYCDKILKVDEGDFDNINTKIGNIVHKVIERVYDDDFDYDSLFDEAAKEYSFTAKESVILEALKIKFKNRISAIRLQNTCNEFKETYSEKEIKVTNSNFKIYGKIDRILDYGDSIVILDYKTGSYNINYELFITYCIYMQLPIYLYLLKNNPQFKDKKVIGVGIQPLIIKHDNSDKNQNSEITHNIDGWFIGDIEEYTKFDSSFYRDEKQKSKYVNRIGLKDGRIELKKGTTFGDSDFEAIVNKTEEIIKDFGKKIKNSEFNISPFFQSKYENACKYCPYKDICFMKNSDYRVVKKEKNETNSDSTESD